MPPEPLAALRHATAGKLQVKSHGLRLGQRYQVRVAECGCGPFRITVRCRGSECESTGVCQCRNTMLVFQHPSFCSHVDVVGGDTEADGPAAAAQGPPNDTEDVGPPPWWGADFDAKFAEVLRVTNTSPHYIDDRLLEQIVVKSTFPDVTIAQWLLAKGFIDESAKNGSINAAFHEQKKRPFQHVVLEAPRTKRKRNVGVGVWHDENGAKLYSDGRLIERGPTPSR